MAKKLAPPVEGPLAFDQLPHRGLIPCFPISRGVTLENLYGVYQKVFGKDSFFVIAYGALNAMGLIGWEKNGLAILWANKGKVLITEHCQNGHGLGRVTSTQIQAYDAICEMDRDSFRDFVNTYPGVPFQILVGKKPPTVKVEKIDPSRFVATKFDSAAAKAKGLTELMNFVAGGFDRLKWTKSLYHTLSQHFGHIAHYDGNGFWGVWFDTIEDQIRFLKHHRTDAIYGDPHFTWSDARRAFQTWLSKGDGRLIVPKLKELQAARIKRAEMALLTDLVAKHPEHARTAVMHNQD